MKFGSLFTMSSKHKFKELKKETDKSQHCGARSMVVRAKNFTSAEEMKDVKKVLKVYYYEELENLSSVDREIWLADQCTSFEQEVREFFNNREAFVDSLHKKLRKITRRWASWNHRSFGPVNSREQVHELIQWTKQNQPKVSQGQLSSTETEEIDPLEKFEQYCEKSSRLLQIFRQNIYRPLCDFFSDDDSDVEIKEIKNLEKSVQKWEALLQFSPVNERLFSKLSEKIIAQSTRTLVHETDSVVRLVPDLYEKKCEALRLARKWRLIVKSKDIQRRGTYTVSPKTLAKRENMPRSRVMAISYDNNGTEGKSYDEISGELKDIRAKYMETKKELHDAKRKCNFYESEISVRTKELEKLREECKQSKDLKNILEFKVNESQVSCTSSTLQNLIDNHEGVHEKLWQKELVNIKMKYSAQKVKYMNAHKHIESLNKQLENSQQRCEQLERSIESSDMKCQKLTEQLDVARKNIQTQSNMVDALQHQCYTLKNDLDQSNIKKGELCTQLTSTLERCKTVENDLYAYRIKVKDLETETGRRKSHEELLERENTQLRHILESKSTRRRSREDILERENAQLKALLQQKPITNSPAKKKDCIFPDINGGRSV